MKVILFIGHHKVGSTALQDFLSRNQVELIKAGILYPSVDFEGMSLALARATGRADLAKGLPINAREPHNALAFRMLAQQKKGKVPPFHGNLPGLPQMQYAIRQQMEMLKPHTVILAGEVFANFATASTDLIGNLADLFPEADLTLVATLRRIDEYLASWHGQRLKFGHHIDPLRGDGMETYFGGIHFNYRKMLQGWFETLPQAQVILRSYDEVRASGGSVEDFVRQTGLDLPFGLEKERKTNESLHRGVYEIARLGNRMLAPAPARHLRQALRQLTPDLGLPPSHDIELFGSRNRDIMLERFAPIHDYLNEVSDRPAFFADLDAVAESRPVPELDACREALRALQRNLSGIEDRQVREFLAELAAHPSEPV